MGPPQTSYRGSEAKFKKIHTKNIHLFRTTPSFCHILNKIIILISLSKRKFLEYI